MKAFKLLRIFALVVAGIAGLVVVFYLILLAVNWKDQPPSSTLVAVHREFDTRPQVSDASNAYVYAAGFSAPANISPQQAGEDLVRRWKQSGRGLREKPEEFLSSSDIDFKAGRSAEFAATIAACDGATLKCLQSLEANELNIAGWVSANSDPLRRYAELQQRTQWQEVVPSSMSVMIPGFGPITDAQRVMLIGLWARAPSTPPAQLRAALDADLRFWRLILANADTLITKMVASAGVRRSLALGELVIRRMNPKEQGGAIPDSWVQPLSQEELSMVRVMKGEVLYAESLILPIKDLATESNVGVMSNEHTFAAWVGNTFVSPLLQPQDTVNKLAEYRMGIAKRYVAPLAQYPRLLQRAKAELSSRSFIPHLYNPIGDLLYLVGEVEYDKYAVRAGDLEGMRRAALLTVQLRSEGLDATDVRERLQHASLKNPYTDAPFEWSENDQGVLFVGLAEGDRGRQVYVY